MLSLVCISFQQVAPHLEAQMSGQPGCTTTSWISTFMLTEQLCRKGGFCLKQMRLKGNETNWWYSQIFLNQSRIWSPISGSGGNTVHSSTVDRMELESLKEFSSYRKDRPIFILPSALSLYVLSLSPSSAFPNLAPSSYPLSLPTALPPQTFGIRTAHSASANDSLLAPSSPGWHLVLSVATLQP